MFWVIFLLVAWAAAGISCGRLCLAAVAAARPVPEPAEGAGLASLTLYEAAFLSGGPYRVTDLTLIAMHRGRRLLLAHTGWVTVVDPEGHDDLERGVLRAIGPAGQARTAAIRPAAAAADAVRALADRLVLAGLAVPEAARTGVAAGVRAVRGATLLVLAMAAAALLMADQSQTGRGPIAAWFSLPLVLTLGCQAIARVEIHPYTRWATPEGQRLLAAIGDSEPDYLTSVAVRGLRAVDDPALRAALGRGRAAQRSH
ncbi:TIGR04222 domain-containing membrane protein [Streptomyces beijiangensis]|uniref:TIGR04222 domain-containing membrane protein n=1 Tax=Streptomyces beijiangensis TaxID=163361 RepID=A0A939JH65_9ACTN|nr:TIGR04222 domain-containing membrane protein [Streptomyces beijiangensis]MBO0514143.1 TIGR04222 domain-containing membrane protein [Streptomyces beijiangensis]